MISTRRTLLQSLAAGTLPCGARAATPPNILVVMSDQESALLPGPARLPNRQKLLARGVSFRSAFCLTPHSAPLRARRC